MYLLTGKYGSINCGFGNTSAGEQPDIDQVQVYVSGQCTGNIGSEADPGSIKVTVLGNGQITKEQFLNKDCSDTADSSVSKTDGQCQNSTIGGVYFTQMTTTTRPPLSGIFSVEAYYPSAALCHNNSFNVRYYKVQPPSLRWPSLPSPVMCTVQRASQCFYNSDVTQRIVCGETSITRFQETVSEAQPLVVHDCLPAHVPTCLLTWPLRGV